MNLKLKTGKEVSLETFSMSMTYGGLLVGEPNEAINDSIIGLIKYSKDWGNKKVLLKKKNQYSSKNVLKPIIYTVWLTSEAVPTNTDIKDASSIVLIWFGEAHSDKSIHEIIIEGVGDFDWDSNAENIYY
ncbi:hypothetical protein GGR22_000709 [Flavobacterium gossypii]|uniref:PLAT domain-containing protein n=1 Tax=Flavobacterium gossypii TaxID=1646119 RepID=A0ABR6DLM9_9FLAO|nr:hypothetical protein [Flavobacterium gossypii]MBA9072583.1 hypothetical protein [Flavobacterium gossypii]